MKAFTLLGLGLCLNAILGCSSSNPAANAGSLGVPAHSSSAKPLTPEQVADRMLKSFESAPVLHVKVLNRHRGVEYESQGWIMGSNVLGEVRQGGKLIFASFSDGRRAQEFVPEMKFPNGMTGRNVLLECDPAEGGWYYLLAFDVACGPASMATSGYSRAHPAPLHEALLGNMQLASMVETDFQGRACYWYHTERVEGTDKIVWDLYVDKQTCEPARLAIVIERPDGRRKKDDVFDYSFRHLDNDRGIQWKLDVPTLKEQSPPSAR